MSATATRLAPVDEANLVLDHAGQVNVFLIAGVLENGGFLRPDGTPDLAALRATVAERIAALPQLRQVVVGKGWRHRWEPLQPDLGIHVRLCPAVEGIPGLEALCGELMGTPLTLTRPLWELLVVPGVGSAQVGIILRIHHAVADGMAAVAIAHRLFDPLPARGSAIPPDAATRPERDLRRALRRLRIGFRRVRLTLTGRQVGSTLLLGERSSRRGVAFVDVDLAALEAGVRPHGATVNDALLASVASGYRTALPAAGEPLPARLPVSVPVALRRSGPSRNQVGVMLVQLPLGEPVPHTRLRLIAEQTRVGKAEARELGTLELMRGPIGASIMNRLAHRQHVVAGFVSNVPGPPVTLRLAGATVASIWPVAILAANVRLGVTAVSYAGRLSCSIHYDAAYVPGAAFVRAMSDELRSLCG
jgi:WS/DGAT/MGAT family acyltransferase